MSIKLILRKRIGQKIQYIEVQVKYGRLYKCTPKWQIDKFDYTSWRFFILDEFDNSHDNLFVAYVLGHPDGYKRDIFIFPAKVFGELVKMGIVCNTQKGPRAKMYIAHSIKNDSWYLWKKYNFEKINDDTAFDVTKYRRNFELKSDGL